MNKSMNISINLRPLKNSDAEQIAQNLKDRNVTRYTFIPHPYTIDDAYSFLKRVKKESKKQTSAVLAIALKENNEIIGAVGFHNINFKDKNAEMGYWLSKKYWGKGVVSKAVQMALDYGFKELKLRRIYAFVFEINLASSKVLLKNGFIHEGTMRKSDFHGNRWHNKLAYGILKEEYQTQTKKNLRK